MRKIYILKYIKKGYELDRFNKESKKHKNTKRNNLKRERERTNSLEYKTTESYTGTRNFSTTTPKNIEYKAENRKYLLLKRVRTEYGYLEIPIGIVDIAEEDYERRVGIGMADVIYDPSDPGANDDGLVETPWEAFRYRRDE